MQKVLRRTALAKKYAKKQARRRADGENRAQRSQYGKRMTEVRRELNNNVRNEKQVRREMWELGPLSPHQNFFSTALEQQQDVSGIGSPQRQSRVPAGQLSPSFGAYSMMQTQLPDKPQKDRVKHCFIAEGDRVVVTNGRVKGTIGTVKGIDIAQERVTLEGINMVDVHIPKELQVEGAQGDIQSMEESIPLSDVELVYPMPDPSTGVPKDVIIKKSALRKRNAYFDIYKNKEVWDRVLYPQRVTLPWPEEQEAEYQDHDNDTLRISVEDTTFLPTLLRPPMPMTVIDELRNKYSIFRDRHEEDYIARKTAEDQTSDNERERSAALVPRGARNVARLGRTGTVKNLGSEPKPKPKLSDFELELIGRTMMAHLSIADAA